MFRFAQIITLTPHQNIVLVTKEALDYLVKYGRELFIDGTFKIVKTLSLITILFRHEKIAVSLVFFRTDCATEENYLWFLRFLKEITKQELKVKILFSFSFLFLLTLLFPLATNYICGL